MSTPLNEALRLHQGGDTKGAAKLYRAILDREPLNVTAIHFLGLALQDFDDFETGIRLLETSIQLQPANAHFYFNFGTVYQKKGMHEKAAACFRRALSINVEMHAARLNLAQSLLESGYTGEALTHFESVCRSGFSFAEAAFGKASCLHIQRRFSDAITALEACPTHPRRGLLLGIILADQGKNSEAIVVLSSEEVRFPGNTELLFRLALCLQAEWRLDDSLIVIDRLIGIAPNHVYGHCLKSNLLSALGQLEEAIDCAHRAISLDPKTPEAHFSLGLALQDARRFKEATSAFDAAASLRDNYLLAQKYAVGSLLLSGDFSAAWDRAEDRHRWNDTMPAEHVRASASVGPWPPPQSIPTHAEVLIIGEQGVGDEIMFGSLLGEYQTRWKNLTVQLDDRLVSLFQRSLPNIRFLSHESGRLTASHKIRLASLPVILRRSVESFKPAPAGFLKHDLSRAQHIKNSISSIHKTRNALICGISWKTLNPFDRGRRSLNLDKFLNSLPKDGARYVNLQYGTTKAEFEALERQLGERLIKANDIDLLVDLEGVAALIACCEHVVTVGNSVAHLAGALGARTSVLLPFSPSWRWFGSGHASLWYESVRLIRQSKPNDWTDPLTRVASILVHHVNSFKNQPY